MIINGVISKVVYTSGKGFAVILIKDDLTAKEIKASGLIADAHKGLPISCEGFYEESKYGKQFKINNYEIKQLDDDNSRIAYLGSGLLKGIGPSTATEIVKKFGENVYNVLDNNPEQLLTVAGIGEKKLAEIKESWSVHRKLVPIVSFLSPAGATILTAQKIFALYGESSIIKLQDNVYRLVSDLDGFGFIKADKIGIGLKIPKDDSRRVDSAIEYTLRDTSERKGDIYIEAIELFTGASKLLGFNNSDTVVRRLNEIVKDPISNIISRIIDGAPVFYFKKYYRQELYVAERINHLKNLKSGFDFSAELNKILENQRVNGFILSDEQIEAVKTVLGSRLSCLRGSPGSGKTTVMKTICDVLNASGKSFCIMAPTGKAGVRAQAVTGYPAGTIHRVFAQNREVESFVFPEDVIIIDESSMPNLGMYNKIFKAITDDKQLIFVGDYDQLPSIGVGDVFRIMCISKTVTTAHLSRVFRQDGGSRILDFIASIYKEGPPDIDYLKTVEDVEKECVFVNYKDPAIRVKKLCDLYRRLSLKGEETQILACKRDGEFGVNTVNKLIQSELNPSSPDKVEFVRGNQILRETDRVMTTQNDYDLEVFNGETGTIEKINLADEYFIIDFEYKKIKIPFTYSDNISLSYAITIHKSQGSEYKNVILVLYSEASYMFSTNLLMTGASRAKKKLIVQGEIKAIHICKNKGSQSIRKSHLLELVDTPEADDLDLAKAD